ncbi:MAG: GSU2403 family nucleotidyltransferase fold protein [Gammaproteobacteria bacterium]|nr:GSU2403 family nucleotidyltransferase fold protein [Gammaproteobacteria bacterium]
MGKSPFSMIGNTLGISWDKQLTRTQDIDIADDFRIHIGLTQHDTNIAKALKSADENFIPVPALNLKSPSTLFLVRGAQLRVDILTPMIGKTSSKPIPLKSLQAMAEPVRFLDYLLEDTQPAVVIAGAGVLVNIPNPARYALHKLVISQRRPSGFQAKANKDLQQAKSILEWLKHTRPGDIDIAMDAANKMPDKFSEQLQKGLERLGRF